MTDYTSYYDSALVKVRASYRLWSLKHQLMKLESSYEHPDQAVSDPKFCALKDAIKAVESEMN